MLAIAEYDKNYGTCAGWGQIRMVKHQDRPEPTYYTYERLMALLIAQKAFVPQRLSCLLLVCYCFNFSKIKHLDECNGKYKSAKKSGP
jgi:hypothetical protein